jgi:type II secretory pathway component GspD/PulD (secretin)
VQAAPAGLAMTIKIASLAAAVTGTSSFFQFMTMSKLKLGFGAMVVAGFTIVFLIQHQAQVKLRAENDSLRQQITQLQTDNEGLSNRLVTAANSNSLSDEQFNELLRLRGEVTRLRQQQKNLPVIAQLKTNNSPSAETIQIHLRTSFVSLPTEDLQILGIEWTTDAQGGRTGFLTEQQLKVINEALQGASDASVISAPQVITINGEHATMSATRKAAVLDLNGDGTLHSTNVTYVNTGTMLDVTPHFSTNSSTFDLKLIVQLVQLTGDSSQPSVQTIQATNQVTLSPGKTVVLEKEIPPGGWLDSPTNATTESRSLLMFVTPQVVDDRDFPKPSPPNQ